MLSQRWGTGWGGPGKARPQYKLCFVPDVQQLEPVSQLHSYKLLYGKET